MDALELKRFELGGLYTNSYLIYSSHSKKGIVIDPAAPATPLHDFIQREDIVIQYVLLTHGHFDHITAIEDFSVSVYLHPDDRSCLTDPNSNCSNFVGMPFTVSCSTQPLNEDSKLTFEAHHIEVFHTPGHSPGSVSMRLGDWLFSGDTLFRQSVGRTDLPNGDHAVLIRSIKTKLVGLPQHIEVYPGHGLSTTIGEECASNPFL